MSIDLYNSNYRYEENERQKKEFEKINLEKTVSEIYFSAIEKASKDFGTEIMEKWEYLLKTNYTKEQAQEEFNYYVEEIRIKNDQDDSVYRTYKNELLKSKDETSNEGKQEILINSLCAYINECIASYSEKLTYVKELPLQIYESNKISRQFEFIKQQANKDKKGDIKIEVKANRTDIAFYCYYTSETKTLKLENVFPSLKAWEEIGKIFNKNAKNIQTTYNIIAYNKEDRLKKTKIKNIEFVIQNLLSDKPEAKKLALNELKEAKLNL